MKTIKHALLIFVALITPLLFPAQVLAYGDDFYNTNDIIFYGGSDCNPSGSSTKLSGNDNAEKVWNALIDDGFNDIQVAGIMGNIQRESGFDPNLTEVNGYGGYGLVQWTFGRRTQLEQAAKEKNVPVDDLGFQIEYFLNEFKTNYKKTYDKIKQVNTIKESVFYFETEFEVSGDWGAAGFSLDQRTLENFEKTPNVMERYQFAKEFYKKFTNKDHALKSQKSNITNIDKPTNPSLVNAKTISQEYRTEPGGCTEKGYSQEKIRKFSLTAKDPSWVNGDFINKIIHNVAQIHGHGESVLLGKGDFIKKTADKYGINTGIFLGQIYKETKMGVFPCGGKYNLGCIAYADWFGFGKAYAADREWIDPPTVEDGIESYFKLVKKVYIEDRGHKTYGEYIDVYSPAYDQDAATGGQESFMRDMYCVINGMIGQDVENTYTNKDGSSNSLDNCNGSSGNWAVTDLAAAISADGFPIISQGDPRWGHEYYGGGMTMGVGACGPTSFAMAMAALGKPEHPLEVAKTADKLGTVEWNVGAKGNQPVVLAQHYGLKSEAGSNDINWINSQLKQGRLIWVGGQGGAPFVNGGHIILIRAVTPSGKWLISNSYGAGVAEMDKEWEPSYVSSMINNIPTAVWR